MLIKRDPFLLPLFLLWWFMFRCLWCYPIILHETNFRSANMDLFSQRLFKMTQATVNDHTVIYFPKVRNKSLSSEFTQINKCSWIGLLSNVTSWLANSISMSLSVSAIWAESPYMFLLLLCYLLLFLLLIPLQIFHCGIKPVRAWFSH